jgi:hypothetical protein
LVAFFFSIKSRMLLVLLVALGRLVILLLLPPLASRCWRGTAMGAEEVDFVCRCLGCGGDMGTGS